MVYCLTPKPLSAADWPQYRGPRHDGTSTETIRRNWTEAEPKVLWKVPLNHGFSSFTIAGGKACTLVQRDVNGVSQEICLALDAETGRELWATPVGPAKYDGGGDSGTKENRGGDGPRSTPSLDGSMVYVLSGTLGLFALEAETGKIVWSKNLLQEFGSKVIPWQNAASPLVRGDLVYVNSNGPKQCLVALNKQNGQVVWKGQDDRMTHATPIFATVLDVPQVVFFAQSGLVSVTPADGKVLWRYPFKYNVSTAASPVVADDLVYCSAGYDVGAGLVRLTKQGDTFKATEVWRKPKDLMNHWSTPVFYQGHLYGMFSFKEFGTGPIKCVELATGTVKWSKGGYGPGGVLLVDGHILALKDTGQLVLLEATPAAYKEIARLNAVTGKCWNAPSLSNGHIYVRSTQEGACIDVSVK